MPFYVSFDDMHYQKEIEEIGIRDFYQRKAHYLYLHYDEIQRLHAVGRECEKYAVGGLPGRADHRDRCDHQHGIIGALRAGGGAPAGQRGRI